MILWSHLYIYIYTYISDESLTNNNTRFHNVLFSKRMIFPQFWYSYMTDSVSDVSKFCISAAPSQGPRTILTFCMTVTRSAVFSSVEQCVRGLSKTWARVSNIHFSRLNICCGSETPRDTKRLVPCRRILFGSPHEILWPWLNSKVYWNVQKRSPLFTMSWARLILSKLS
jgi:hypothetical protein